MSLPVNLTPDCEYHTTRHGQPRVWVPAVRVAEFGLPPAIVQVRIEVDGAWRLVGTEVRAKDMRASLPVACSECGRLTGGCCAVMRTDGDDLRRQTTGWISLQYISREHRPIMVSAK